MRSYTVGRIWDIPVRVSLSLVVFLPVMAWLIGSGQQLAVYAGLVTTATGTPVDLAVLQVGTTPWVVGTLAALGLFVSVGLHELGHAWMAMRYGLSVESITLWILGGIARLDSVPREWNREFWIAVAGPTTSVLVGGGWLLGATAVLPSRPVVGFVFGWLAVTNVALAAFNMLPAFPLDGGRVFRALLARTRSYRAATRAAARAGTASALLFVVVGVVWFSPLLLLVAVFLYSASKSESRTVTVGELLDGLTVADLARTDVETVDAGESVARLLDQLVRDRRSELAVERDGTIVGVVSLQDARHVPQVDRDGHTVGDIATEPTVRFDTETDAFEALSGLSDAKETVAIVERDGQAVGVVSLSDFKSTLDGVQSLDSGRAEEGR